LLVAAKFDHIWLFILVKLIHVPLSVPDYYERLIDFLTNAFGPTQIEIWTDFCYANKKLTLFNPNF
jgi:hypothetical protein